MTNPQNLGDSAPIPRFGKGRSPILSRNHDPIVDFCNALKHITVKRSPSAKVDKVVYSSSGITIFLGGNVAGSGSGSGELQTYRVKSKTGDVLYCRTWDADTSTEGTSVIEIATNFESRQLSSEVTGLGTFTYSAYAAADSFNKTRNSNDGSSDETQMVTPLWYENCIISACAITSTGVVGTGGADIKIIEVSSRCWAKVQEEA